MVHLTKLLAASTFLLAGGGLAAPPTSTLDKRAVVNDPKIGIELENRSFHLVLEGNPSIKSKDPALLGKAAKGAPFTFANPALKALSKPEWAVTAEIEQNTVQKFVPEIIVNGGAATQERGVPLKVGENVGKRIGREITTFVNTWVGDFNTAKPDSLRAYIKNWTPKNYAKESKIDLKELNNFSWKVNQVGAAATKGNDLVWGLQVTAPFPLSELRKIVQHHNDDSTPARSVLIDSNQQTDKNLVWVNECYIPFIGERTNPEVGRHLDYDTLGFISLVQSYIRASKTNDAAKGMKHSTTVMPRTDFKAMYRDTHIKDTIEGLIKKYYTNPKFAQYWNKNADVKKYYKDTEIKDFTSFMYAICRVLGAGGKGGCSSSDNFATMTIRYTEGTITVKQWLDDIGSAKAGKDRLSELDGKRNAQIGGLGDVFEKQIGGTRPLPIFEFRDIAGAPTKNLEAVLGGLTAEIYQHHERAPKAVRALSKRAVPKAPAAGKNDKNDKNKNKKNKTCIKLPKRNDKATDKQNEAAQKKQELENRKAELEAKKQALESKKQEAADKKNRTLKEKEEKKKADDKKRCKGKGVVRGVCMLT